MLTRASFTSSILMIIIGITPFAQYFCIFSISRKRILRTVSHIPLSSTRGRKRNTEFIRIIIIMSIFTFLTTINRIFSPPWKIQHHFLTICNPPLILSLSFLLTKPLIQTKVIPLLTLKAIILEIIITILLTQINILRLKAFIHRYTGLSACLKHIPFFTFTTGRNPRQVLIH